MKRPFSFKDYCLLENGDIEDCYYGNADGSFDYSEPRWFEKEGRHWYLTHDHYGNGFCITFRHKVIKFSNSKEELEEHWRKHYEQRN